MRQAIFVAVVFWCGVAQAGFVFSTQNRIIISQATLGNGQPSSADAGQAFDFSPFVKATNATVFADAGRYAIAIGHQQSSLGDAILIFGDARRNAAGTSPMPGAKVQAFADFFLTSDTTVQMLMSGVVASNTPAYTPSAGPQAEAFAEIFGGGLDYEFVASKPAGGINTVTIPPTVVTFQAGVQYAITVDWRAANNLGQNTVVADTWATVDFSLTPVPEPASLLLGVVGMAMLLVCNR